MVTSCHSHCDMGGYPAPGVFEIQLYAPYGTWQCTARALRCYSFEEDPFALSSAVEMDIGPSFPGSDFLAEIESMAVASYRPIAEVCARRAGQAAYVGRAVNLEQRAHKFYDNFPPRPPDPPFS